MRLWSSFLALLAALWVCGCASQPAYHRQWTEVTSHLPDADSKAEHDDVESADGIKTEYYPNRQTPQRITYRFPHGGIIDSRCLTGELHCRHWEMKVTGFRPGYQPPGFRIDMAEGIYTLTATDDPWVAVMKNEDQMTVGYWATNRHGRGVGVVRTYPEAQTVTNLE
jgi:hypothetical protein